MTERRLSRSEYIATFGIIIGIIAAIFWATTNCSWWDHSFCNDSSVISTLNTVLFMLIGLAVLLFFAGGIAREINMEGKLGRAEDDTELRRQYERRHITSKPLLPNLVVVIGLILIFGVSTTVIKAFDNSQLDQSFYQVLNVALAAVGIAMSVTGFYLKTKTKDKQTTHDHPA